MKSVHYSLLILTKRGISPTSFRKNLSNGLVADTGLQMDRHDSHTIRSFLLCDERLALSWRRTHKAYFYIGEFQSHKFLLLMSYLGNAHL
jgi:hypothetical protein